MSPPREHLPGRDRISGTIMVALDEGDDRLLQAIAGGDERVVARLVDAWGAGMRRIALAYVGSPAVADEVVQETWLTVLRTVSRFERRSSLRTWVIGIVVNLARSRARAERRVHPRGRSISGDPDERQDRDRSGWPPHGPPPERPWRSPEDHLLAGEAHRVLMAAIAQLPPLQRGVIVRRDLLGMTAGDVCGVLGLSDTHQRVLLHRARVRVRHAIERYSMLQPRDRSVPVARTEPYRMLRPADRSIPAARPGTDRVDRSAPGSGVELGLRCNGRRPSLHS